MVLNKYEVVNKWTKFLSLIGILVLLLLCFNTYFWTDDLSDRYFMPRVGQINVLWEQYMGWDGRAFSPFFLIRNLMLCYTTPELVAIFTTLCFLLTSAFLTKVIFTHILLLKLKKDEWFVISFVFAIALWMGMRPHLSRSFYWATGSFYTDVNLLVGLWIFYFSNENKRIWIISILSFCLTLSGVNVAAGALTLYTGAVILRLIPFTFKGHFPIMAALLIGTVITTFAPGNFARVTAGAGQLSFNLQALVLGYFQVLKEYVLMSKWIFMGSIVFVVCFHSFIINTSAGSRKIVLWALLFFIAALATIVPFAPIPEAASKHTSIYFQTFLFLSLICTCSFFLTRFLIAQVVQKISIVLFLIYFIGVGLNQFKLGRSVKMQALKRDHLLKEKEGSRSLIVLDPIEMTDDLFTNRSWDITTDTAAWENRTLRQYYNTGPIKLKE